MKWRNLNRFFDRDKAYDSYTGDYLYKVQATTFSEQGLDGNVQRKRTLSMDPDIVLPVHGCLTMYGEAWITSRPLVEGFYSRAARKTCIARLGTNQFCVLTPNAAVNQTLDSPKFGHVKHLKDTVNSGTDSQYDPQYAISMAEAEKPVKGYFLQDAANNDLYSVRSVYFDAEGFRVVVSDLLDSSLTNPTLAVGLVPVEILGDLDPMTEARQVIDDRPGILMDMYLAYNYTNQAQETNHAGDMSLIVAGDSLVQAGHLVTTHGETNWLVLSVQPYHDGLLVQLRSA